jgi:hypothetical protein
VSTSRCCGAELELDGMVDSPSSPAVFNRGWGKESVNAERERGGREGEVGGEVVRREEGEERKAKGKSSYGFAPAIAHLTRAGVCESLVVE